MPVLNPIHHLLQKEPTLVFPGVYDALGAKLVERAGFPLTFIPGYSVAAMQLDLPAFQDFYKILQLNEHYVLDARYRAADPSE